MFFLYYILLSPKESLKSCLATGDVKKLLQVIFKKMGFLIDLEGGDGTGKTTQVKLLKRALEDKGYSVFVSGEPGGPEFAEAIRRVLLDPQFKGKVSSRAEMFLYMASRAQHTEEWIIPKVKEFDFYITSRYALSSVVYQGYGRDLLDEVKACNSIATQKLIPDLTIVIDLPKGKGVDRVETKEFGKKDRLELEPIRFHEKVSLGYVKEAELDSRIKILPYLDDNPKEMHKQILDLVLGLIKK